VSNTWLRGVLLTVALAAVGCSDSDTPGVGTGGASSGSSGGSGTTAKGGATGTSVGGSPTGGGTQVSTGGTTTGVTTSTGGKSSAGGSQSTGGSTADNTNPDTGGSTSAGGTKSTGGTTSAGGKATTGGKAGTGGATAVGGGSSKGGSAPTGGTKADGGSAATGGTKADGGSAATGGSEATGGTTSTEPAEPKCFTSSNNTWNSATVTTASSGSADVTVGTTEGQTWEGFGGAFNELGWKYLTSDAMKEQAIKLLFSSEDGINFAWGRIPIGASDYGEIRYTLDDTADPNDPTPNSGESNRPPADTGMTKFSLARDGKYLIPYIKAALAVKPELRFWASPWTPPVWMKTGYKTNSGSDSSQNAKRPSYFDGGTMKSDTATLNAFAEYYKKFVQGYKDEGINVEIVSPQNEPGYDQNYPSCLWDKTTYVSFIKILAQAMSSFNVKVMLGSLSNAGDGGRSDLDIASAVLADSAAKAAVSVVGVQWGVLDKVNSGQTFQGLPIWGSEHKCGNYPWMSGYNSSQAPNDQAYGVESWGYIRDAITKGKVTSYNSWNMVLDKSGLGNDTTRDWKQNALLVADGGQVKTTPTYYVFRHFSQYVVPGAKVLSTTGGDAVAFKNPDGSVVAVVYNSGGAKQNFVVKVGSKSLQFNMPGSGWATVVSPP